MNLTETAQLEQLGELSYTLMRDPFKCAEALGLECLTFMPDSPILTIDLDTPEAVREFEDRLRLFFGVCDQELGYRGITQELRTVSNSGNTHVYLLFDRPLTTELRVAFQAALGSDHKRELFESMRRAFRLRDEGPVLFETPAEAARVREWLASCLRPQQNEDTDLF